MKRLLLCLSLALAARSAFAAAPAPNANTGELAYTYEVEMPRARGRHQPAFQLAYSSGARHNMGFGYGWTPDQVFIERDTHAAPGKVAVPATDYVVNDHGRRSVLVPVASGGYRLDVEPEYRSFAFGNNRWTAVDSSGTRFTYSCVTTTCNRWYLTTVQDLDQNLVRYEYLDEGGASALLTAIRYNNYAPGSTAAVGDTGQWAAAVTLEYGAEPTPYTESVAGTLVTHRKLLARIRVQLGAPLTTIRGYELGYDQAWDTRASTLTRITEKGGDFEVPRPPTTFGYTPYSYAFSAATDVTDTTGSSPTIPGCSSTIDSCYLRFNVAYMDLDGDGRPDLIDPGHFPFGWSRNVTPPGDSTVVFEPWQVVSGASGPTSAGDDWLRDFDGDGLVDILSVGTAECGNGGFLAIRLGSKEGGTFHFLPAVCADRREVTAVWGAAGLEGAALLRDVNGDGVLDYTVRTSLAPPSSCAPGCAAAVFYGKVVRTGSSVAISFERQPALTSTAFRVLSANPDDPFQELDVNGDGFLDSLLVQDGNWTAWLNTGAGTFGPATTLSGSSYLRTLWDNATISVGTGGGCTSWDIGVGVAIDDSKTQEALVDFNGDGLPDYDDGGQVSFNTGVGFNYVGVAAPSVYPVEQRAVILRCYNRDGDPIYATDPTGNISRFIDLNGDGIVDYVTSGNAGWHFYAGSAGVAGVRSGLLQMITTPSGARYDVRYAPSTLFGGEGRSVRPLVKSVTQSGVALATTTLEYWYLGEYSATVWNEPWHTAGAGFSVTWSRDSTSRLVTKTYWNGSDLATRGTPAAILVGPETAGGTATTPPEAALEYRAAFDYGLKRATDGLGQGCLTSTPLPSDYPLRVIPTSSTQYQPWAGLSAYSTTKVSCSDVDGYGNLTAVSTDSDAAHAGNRSIKRRTFGPANAPDCPACVTSERLYDDSGTELLNKLWEYDTAGHPTRTYSKATDSCNYSGGVTGEERYGYQGNGLLAVKRLGDDVETEYLYDATTQVRIEQEATVAPGSTKALVVLRAHDAAGLPYRQTTPFIVMLAGAFQPGSLLPRFDWPADGPEVYQYFDKLGRPLVLARKPMMNGSYQEVLEAHEYLDSEPLASPPRPVATRTHRFSTAVSYAPGAIPSGSSNDRLSITYLDALGRTIQIRERLGAAGSGATGTEVGGYRVSGTTLYDGAGRVRATVDPYYSWKEAFAVSVDPGSYPALAAFNDGAEIAAVGVRGTVFTFDAAGRVTCAVYRPFPGSVPAAESSCATVDAEGDAYRLATITRYGTDTLPGESAPRYFVETVPPDVNRTSPSARGARQYLDATGRPSAAMDAAGNYTQILRDGAGRELATLRQAADLGGSRVGDPIYTSTTWNAAGQATELRDPSAGHRLTCYDAAGRVKLRGTFDDALGRQTEYVVFDYGDLGRITAKRQHMRADSSNPSSPEVDAAVSYHYDTPYLPGHANTAGRLAWSDNAPPGGTASTVVAFSYDRQGRVIQRDQWFADGVPAQWTATAAPQTNPQAIGPFSTTFSYADDGTLQAVQQASGPAAAPYGATTAYRVGYDSAGRPVAVGSLTGDGTRYWGVDGSPQPLGGFFDPAGRVSTQTGSGQSTGAITLDNGAVRAARTYSLYSGQLLADSRTLTASGAPLYAASTFTYQGQKLAGFVEGASGTQYGYTYTSTGELSTSTATPVGGALGTTQSFSEAYSHRADGRCEAGPGLNNLTAVFTGSCGSSDGDRYEYGAGSERLSLAWVQSFAAADTSWAIASESFTYDAEDRLLGYAPGVGQAQTLWYGADGELTMRREGSTMTYYVGPHATVTARLPAGCEDAGCAIDRSTLRVDAHVQLGGPRVATVRSSASGILQTLYYHRDHRGSVVATTRAGGALGVQLRYTPYGALDRVSGADAGDTSCRTSAACPDISYNSALRIGDGLLYMKARVYHVGLRRFLTADTVDPVRYAFVRGDPVNFNDPSGRMKKAAFQPAVQFTPSESCWADYGAPVSTIGGPDRIRHMLARMQAEALVAIAQTYAEAEANRINSTPPQELNPITVLVLIWEAKFPFFGLGGSVGHVGVFDPIEPLVPIVNQFPRESALTAPNVRLSLAQTLAREDQRLPEHGYLVRVDDGDALLARAAVERDFPNWTFARTANGTQCAVSTVAVLQAGGVQITDHWLPGGVWRDLERLSARPAETGVSVYTEWLPTH